MWLGNDVENHFLKFYINSNFNTNFIKGAVGALMSMSCYVSCTVKYNTFKSTSAKLDLLNSR